MNAPLRGSPWLLDPAINVVIFAGMGGACDGIEAAGYPVHVAINHDPVAIAVHEARHPHTRHLRADVREVCPRDATGGRPVKILWASPDCRHFSRAKGRAPVSKAVRSLPWIVCRWAGMTRPEHVFVENVPEIVTWGPLIARRDPATGRVLKLDGTVAAKGERVPLRQQQLVPDAKRQGRTFSAWRSHLRGLGYSLDWRPQVCADHGIPTTRKRFWGVARRDGAPPLYPARSHAPRAKAKALALRPWLPAADCIDWSRPCPSIFGRKKPLAEATLRRIARGVMRYVVEAAEPFIVPITHAGDARCWPAGEPLRTVTTAHRGEMAVIAPYVSPLRRGDDGSHAAEPLPTATASASLGLVAAHVTKFRKGATGSPLDEPLPTVTANSFNKRPGGAIPLGLVAGTLVQLGYGEREGQAPRALDAGEPLGTQVAGGCKVGVVSAFLAQHNGNPGGAPNPGRPASEPLSALTQACSHQQVVAAQLMVLRGTNRAGKAVTDPLPAVTARGTHLGVVAAFLQQYYSSGGQDQDAREPLGAVTTKARSSVVTVTIKGETYALADIGMRMLEPEECAAAHGFPPGALPAEITIDGKRRRLTKTERYALIGNSVPPRMAMLLVQANVRPALAPPPVLEAVAPEASQAEAAE